MFANVGESFLADKGIKRRDPSDVIRVDDVYYVWYTKMTKDTPGFLGGWGGTIWYATSQDGKTWKDQAQALDKAPHEKYWGNHGT